MNTQKVLSDTNSYLCFGIEKANESVKSGITYAKAIPQ